VDTILDMLLARGEHLLGRFSGPLNFRLVVMPLVVSFLALRGHWTDVREGRPTIFGAFVTDPVKRRRLFRSALTDIDKVLVMAIVLDTVYQLWVFRRVYPGEALMVAFLCAVVPYVLVRGPITRIARLLYRKWAGKSTLAAFRQADRE
jgi:hypothetical protein